MDEHIIADVCTTLMQTVLPPNEIICYAGHLCTHIYILIEGSIYLGAAKKVLGPCYTIGILEAFYNLPVLKTVVCQTYCKLLVIEYSKMKHIYAKYSEYHYELEKLILS